MAKAKQTPTELVESHKPKNVVFKYIFTDESLVKELYDEGYDITTLDTINDDDLIEAALQAECVRYDREIVGKAKQPSFLDRGIIISKKLVTKADKKLLGVHVGIFEYNSTRIVIKLEYERFTILEIFNLI